jgi:hypothetical protein
MMMTIVMMMVVVFMKVRFEMMGVGYSRWSCMELATVESRDTQSTRRVMFHRATRLRSSPPRYHCRSIKLSFGMILLLRRQNRFLDALGEHNAATRNKYSSQARPGFSGETIVRIGKQDRFSFRQTTDER